MKKINFIMVLVSSLSPMLSLAQWNSNTTINTPVSIAPQNQKNIHMVTDANEGAIIAWDDKRDSVTNSTDIYVQRLDKFGNSNWTANGVVIRNDIATQKNVTLIDAGNGSAIMAWEDKRTGNYNIYAQKINSSGAVLWTANGVAITNNPTTQKNPKIISDNAGGAIIVWEDSVNSYFDIYAQRINSAGIVQWAANGVGICTAVNAQSNPKIDTDGAGGGIITWQDKRNNSDYDIYAQKINSAGVVQWAANGVVICNAIGKQNNPRIEPDGSNGAIIAWDDKRNGMDYDIYAQRINSTGAVQWTNNGVAVCNATGNQSAVDFKYAGTNGIIVCWKDSRNNNYQIYFQMINLQGAAQLNSNGILLSNNMKADNPNVIGGGQGTAIIVWQDSSAVGWDIKSQKINSSGTIQWNSGGTIVSNAADNQMNADNVSDGQGGAIYAWEDNRNGTDYDVFAQHLKDTIIITGINNIEELKLKTKCYPNPVLESHSTIYFLSENNLEQTVKIYNSVGQLIITDSTDNRGVCSIDANLLSNGFYLFKIESKNNSSIEVGNFIVAK